MIGIINYGVGNIKAFANIYKRLNIPYKIVSTSRDLAEVNKIILPGVGAFDHAMVKLKSSGIEPLLSEMVLDKKIPVLGICVGMQMLADSSEEGMQVGLGWIKGTVKKFILPSDKSLPLPHMGWNTVRQSKPHMLFNGLEECSKFYFLHSYYFECADNEDELATTDYGVNFSSIIHHDNILGIQCHPEKSHNNGVILLRNFGEL